MIGHFKSSYLTKNNCQQKRKTPERPTENEWIGPLTEKYKEKFFLQRKNYVPTSWIMFRRYWKKTFQTFNDYKQPRKHQCGKKKSTGKNVILNFRGQLNPRRKSTIMENFTGSHQPKSMVRFISLTAFLMVGCPIITNTVG